MPLEWRGCGNYKGITLMSHTMKAWQRTIEERLVIRRTVNDEQLGLLCYGR